MGLKIAEEVAIHGLIGLYNKQMDAAAEKAALRIYEQEQEKERNNAVQRTS